METRACRSGSVLLMEDTVPNLGTAPTHEQLDNVQNIVGILNMPRTRDC